MPGLTKLDLAGQDYVTGFLRRARGTCTGGGSYRDAAGHFQAFVVGESQAEQA